MNRATLWAVVPVKSFNSAKQRLTPVLDADERAGLARAMFEDVLDVLAQHPALAGTLVVTNDAEAASLARAKGVGVLADQPDAGLVPAVRHAARTLAAARCAGMLVVPADLPSIKAADIELIALGHRHTPAVTLVAAGSDGGTNALACSPPDVLPICYGEDSFRRHHYAAKKLGLAPRVLTLPRFELDIDRPDDLLAFMAQPASTRTHAWLQNSGIARRLLARRVTAADTLADWPARLAEALTCDAPAALYQKG